MTDALSSYLSNDTYMAQADIDGETKRWAFARTVINGVPVDFDAALDQIAVPGNDGQFLAQYFHPRNIYIAEGNGHITSNFGDSYSRLYLGDFADSKGILSIHSSGE